MGGGEDFDGELLPPSGRKGHLHTQHLSCRADVVQFITAICWHTDCFLTHGRIVYLSASIAHVRNYGVHLNFRETLPK